MYNTLVLAALLPLSGPTAGEQLSSLSTPAPAEIRVVESTSDPGDRIPVIPNRMTVAYAPDSETPIPVWSSTTATTPSPAVPPSNPAAPTTTSRTANTPSSVPSTFASTAGRPNELEFRGRLMIPQWNKVPLAANFQAQLMSLKTAQRDASGRIVNGPDGRPVLLPLREGMHVVEGQVLGNFDIRYLEAQRTSALCKLKVAQAEAEKEIELKYALTGVNSEKASLAILEDANSMHEGAVTKLDIIQAKLKVEQAIANYELQSYNLNVVKKEELNVQRQEVEMADVMIQLRQLVSPISGIIVKISKAEGEWLREGDEVLQIVQLDTLRVVCKVDANLYDQDSIAGKAASVTAPLPNGKTEVFPGKVVFVDPSIDSGGDVFDVYVEVQNRPSGSSWMLQPNRMVSVAIKL